MTIVLLVADLGIGTPEMGFHLGLSFSCSLLGSWGPPGKPWTPQLHKYNIFKGVFHSVRRGLHVTITHDLFWHGYLPPSSHSLHLLSLSADIWWQQLDTDSNLFTWGPTLSLLLTSSSAYQSRWYAFFANAFLLQQECIPVGCVPPDCV